MKVAAGRMHRTNFIVHMHKQRFLMDFLTSNTRPTGFARFANLVSRFYESSHSQSLPLDSMIRVPCHTSIKLKIQFLLTIQEIYSN
jgi:predicted DNA-binding ribbon-helix-helix protein